jgi:hypothetical protein
MPESRKSCAKGVRADSGQVEIERVPVKSNHLSSVMPALVAGIRVFLQHLSKQDVDGRDKPHRR